MKRWPQLFLLLAMPLAALAATYTIFNPGPAGPVKSNGSYSLAAESASDVASLFGCSASSSLYLNGGGGCTLPTASYSGTLTVTGCTTSPTVAFSAQTIGTLAIITIDPVTCTSNATTFTMTGLPAALSAAVPQILPCAFWQFDDNSAAIQFVQADISGTVVHWQNAATVGLTWTASGTKGSLSRITFVYQL